MQNPALTEHLRYIEQEKTRAYIVGTMRWSCPKPSEAAKVRADEQLLYDAMNDVVIDAYRGMVAFHMGTGQENSVA